MPIFEYHATKPDGSAIRGTVFGSNLNDVASELGRQGLTVQQIGVASMPGDPVASTPRPEASARVEGPQVTPPVSDPLLERRPAIVTDVLGPLFLKAPLSDLLFFFRQLSTMLNAGVGMVQSLDTLSSQTGNAQLRNIVRELREHALAGRPISAGMQRYPEMFTPLMLSLVRVGEETGQLDKSLRQLAQYLDKEIELRNLYRRVTIYPKLVIGASILIVLATNAIISSFGKQGGLSSPLTNPATWVILAPLLFFLFLFFRVGIQNPAIRHMYDSVTQALPYLGKTLRQLAMAKFGRAFGSLYAGGVPVTKSVRIAADTCGNEYLRARIYPCADEIEAGGSITEAFARTGAFSPIVLDMTRTGETTGNLDQMLTKLAEYYEDEAATRSTQMGYVFGVVALLAVAVYVGYMVITFWTGYASGAIQAGGGL